MEPLQLWLPVLNAGSKGARDRRRAVQEWSGETRIWLQPGLDESFTYVTGREFEAVRCIASEKFDRYDIYHVHPDGEVQGVEQNGRFAGPSVIGLLEEWLSCPVGVVPAPKTIEFAHVPTSQNRKMVLERWVIKTEPWGAIPTASAGKNLLAVWPPPGEKRAAISPDEESAELAGTMHAAFEGELAYGVKEQTGERILWWALKWPAAIQQIVAGSDGIDLLLAREQMRQIAESMAHDPDAALIEASKRAAFHVEEGYAYRAVLWYQRAYSQGGGKRILFEAEDHGFVAPDLDSLHADPRFADFLRERVPVRRAWGAAGLFWSLFLDRLKEGRSFKQCRRCRRFISGRPGKLYCSWKEHPECFANRRSLDQRRSRSGRKP